MVNKLNIKEYWKLELKNNDTSNKVLQLKEQYNSAQKDIQLRCEDKVLPCLSSLKELLTPPPRAL